MDIYAKAGTVKKIAPSQQGRDDPDRKSPRHDLAVSFAGTILGKLTGIEKYLLCFRPEEKLFGHVKRYGVALCHPGHGCEGDQTYSPASADALIYPTDTAGNYYQGDEMIILEVKITREPVGNIIRQIEGYRCLVDNHGAHPSRALLLVDFDLCDAEAEMLASKKIEVFRLGPDFEKYVEQQSKSRAPLRQL